MKKYLPLLALCFLLVPRPAHALGPSDLIGGLTGWATDAFVPSSASLDKFSTAAGAISDWGPFGMVKNTFNTITNITVNPPADAGLVWRAGTGAKFGASAPTGFGTAGYTIPGSGTGSFSPSFPGTGGTKNGGYNPTPKPSASPGSDRICKDVSTGYYDVGTIAVYNVSYAPFAVTSYSLSSGGSATVYWSLSAVGDTCLSNSNTEWQLRVNNVVVKSWLMNDAINCSPSYQDSATVTLQAGQNDIRILVRRPTGGTAPASVSGAVNYIRTQSGNCTAPTLPTPTPAPTPVGTTFTVRMVKQSDGGDCTDATPTNLWTYPNGGGGGYPADVYPVYLSSYGTNNFTFACPAAGNYLVYADSPAGPLGGSYKLYVGGKTVGNLVNTYSSSKGGLYSQYLGVVALSAGSNVITFSNLGGGGGYLHITKLRFTTAASGTAVTTNAYSPPTKTPISYSPSPSAAPAPHSVAASSGATYQTNVVGIGGTVATGTGGIPGATVPTMFNPPDATATGPVICDFRPMDGASGTGSFAGTVRAWGRYLVGLAVYGACMIWAFKVTQVKVSMD